MMFFMKSKVLWTVSILILISILIFNIKFKNRYFGEIIFMSGEALTDYVLISPLPRNPRIRDEKNVLLINKNARIHHQWRLKKPILISALDNFENLWAMHFSAKNDTEIAGESDEIAQYSWSGDLLRTIKGQIFSHDFDFMPNNLIATISIHKLSKAEQRRTQLLKNSRGLSYSDKYIILNWKSEVIWEWSLVDHLEDLKYIPGTINEFELGHSNSIRYVDLNPINFKPALLVSIRNLSRIVLIEIESKKILWMSPKNLLSFQHDATIVEGGNIMIFDNGLDINRLSSRVIEIDPRTNNIIWEYGLSAPMVPVMGSAQRLQNGNTLISTGIFGQVFQIDRNKKINWNYILPPISSSKLIQNENYWQGHSILRARQYSLKYNN
jgi:hypothetical protein